LALDTLLTAIKKKWPAVEFITSDELGEIIEEDK
jgi:lambda repressor-like predicted transcriptional regulator